MARPGSYRILQLVAHERSEALSPRGERAPGSNRIASWIRHVAERGTPCPMSRRAWASRHTAFTSGSSSLPRQIRVATNEWLDAKSEIPRLRAKMRRVEEEPDLPKKAAPYFVRQSRVKCRWLHPAGNKPITPACEPCFRVPTGVYALVSGRRRPSCPTPRSHHPARLRPCRAAAWLRHCSRSP